jgi:iron complex transport system ATP-binding protein
MEEIISLDNVSYIRNGKYILKDINWHVNRGEHWVILARTAAAKPPR